MTSATTARPLPSDVRSFLERQPRGLFIDGDWVTAGEHIRVVNPATEEKLCHVAAASSVHVDMAVSAARRAFDGGWSTSSPATRRRRLHRIANLIETHGEEIAFLETLDNGKPLDAARGDVQDALEWFRFFAGFPGRLHGMTPEHNRGDLLAYTRREPVGVCGLVIPWNYPLVMASWKLGPALACGCTAILKPAEQTPLSALRLAELIQEADLPPGVVNVLPGLGHVAGKELVSHRGVDKVAFTGSTDVARSIMADCAPRLRRISLEAGGKSPNIVFVDADLDKACKGAAFAIFHNLGQDCTAGSRLLVERPIFNEIATYVASAGSALVIGNGLDPASEVGPVVSDAQRQRVNAYVDAGVRDGARLVEGRTQALPDSGYFVSPAVLATPPRTSRVWTEEIFGPVVVVEAFDGEDEAVQLANETDFGLGAGIWTSDIARAHRMAARVRAGTVWINNYNTVDPAVPFGGFKQSGIGREHGYSAIELYTEMKSVWVQL